MIPFKHKVAVFFTGIVIIMCAVFLAVLLMLSENRWREQKQGYISDIMDHMYSIQDVQEQQLHARVFDNQGNTIYNQGIFSENIDTTHDMIIEHNGRHYYTYSGNNMCFAQDITEVIIERKNLIHMTLVLGGISIIIVYIIGFLFAHYLLWPVRRIHQAVARFSLSDTDTSHHIHISGKQSDDIVVLAGALNTMFDSILEQAQKIEQFSADVSHEFKNKLFEIRSHVQLVQKKQNYKEGIDKIAEVLDPLDDMISSLLMLARLGTSEVDMHTSDIGELLQSTDQLQDPRVSFEQEGKSVHMINIRMMRLVCENLLNNALKYSDPKTGKVHVSVTPHKLIISDNGIGIDTKNLQHIFARFFKEDRARSYASGWGLGLAIVKKIIDLHGFTIDIMSTKGEGTQVEILFRDE